MALYRKLKEDDRDGANALFFAEVKKAQRLVNSGLFIGVNKALQILLAAAMLPNITNEEAAFCNYNIAVIYLERKHWSFADRYLVEALRLANPNGSIYNYCRQACAELMLYRQGCIPEVASEYRELIRIYSETQDHEYLSSAYRGLAQYHLKSHNTQQGYECLNSALQIVEDCYGIISPEYEKAKKASDFIIFNFTYTAGYKMPYALPSNQVGHGLACFPVRTQGSMYSLRQRAPVRCEAPGHPMGQVAIRCIPR